MSFLSRLVSEAIDSLPWGHSIAYPERHATSSRAREPQCFEVVSMVVAAKHALAVRQAALASPDTSVCRSSPLDTRNKVKLVFRVPAGRADALISRIMPCLKVSEPSSYASRAAAGVQIRYVKSNREQGEGA